MATTPLLLAAISSSLARYKVWESQARNLWMNICMCTGTCRPWPPSLPRRTPPSSSPCPWSSWAISHDLPPNFKDPGLKRRLLNSFIYKKLKLWQRSQCATLISWIAFRHSIAKQPNWHTYVIIVQYNLCLAMQAILTFQLVLTIRRWQKMSLYFYMLQKHEYSRVLW